MTILARLPVSDIRDGPEGATGIVATTPRWEADGTVVDVFPCG